MVFNPHIYYAVAESSSGNKPAYAHVDEGADHFFTTGMFEGLDSGNIRIEIIWYDFITEKYYKFSHISPDTPQTIIFMVLTAGGCVLWLTFNDRTNVISEFNCEQTTVLNSDFEWENFRLNLLGQYRNGRLNLMDEANKFLRGAQELMQKFSYRYWPVVENKEIDLLGVRELLSDGSVTQLIENEIFEYQSASKPRKLDIKFVCEESNYELYIWFEEVPLLRIFERFYGAHPETKADFIIWIDADNNKYELALYRQGLKEPVMIPRSAYQLIVFKNKFEEYRSENYDQPRGAWLW